MFVTLDGEVLAKKVFRRARYGINLRVGKGKKGIKKINNNILQRNFPQNIIN